MAQEKQSDFHASTGFVLSRHEKLAWRTHYQPTPNETHPHKTSTMIIKGGEELHDVQPEVLHFFQASQTEQLWVPA